MSRPPERRARAGSTEAAAEASSGRTVCGQVQPHQILPKTTVTARMNARNSSVAASTMWNSLIHRTPPKA